MTTLFESAGGSSRGSSLDNYEFTFETYLQDAASIEPDPNPTSTVFDTQSLSESIACYEKENGRTYHSYHSGSYPYPNDPTENERLDGQHTILRKVLDGRNHLAPFSKGVGDPPAARVLDIGCGTGIWAIEMGDDYPSAQIVGVDLSPIQPGEVPPNVRFFVEDSDEDWFYTTPFSYIHTRMTLGCWSSPPQIIRKAFDNLLPGGYFEAQEVLCVPDCDDGTLDPQRSAWMRWVREVQAASDEADRVLCVGPDLKRWMEEAGFVDVEERVFRLPMNGWPQNGDLKHIGQLWQRNLLNGLSGFSLGLLSRVRGREREDIELQLVEVRRELFDTSIHAYQKFYVVWGRKPGGESG
ncbi:S-adenosyl-L-methionine-dependent methyltransferase [Coniochaeta sp. 2T2.1]|nr:S-adenosyl-L-methionine-dependent methyltransferase [Coniochaeta sp. 2T2.1]